MVILTESLHDRLTQVDNSIFHGQYYCMNACLSLELVFRTGNVMLDGFLGNSESERCRLRALSLSQPTQALNLPPRQARGAVFTLFDHPGAQSPWLRKPYV